MAALLVGCLSVAQAADKAGGISLAGTRLIFDGSKGTSSMTVTNSSSKDVWLMRFWVSAYGQNDSKAATNMPFAVTPPLYRLDAGSAVDIRVNKLSDNLPADRESVFYLNNLAIPPKKGEKSYQKAVQSGLQFAVNTRIKMFYRPAAIAGVDAVKAAPQKLTVQSSGNTLTVKNPTPYHITLSQMTVNGKVAKVAGDGDSMVVPFGSLQVQSAVAHGTFSYRTVNDNGATEPVIDKRF
jgi:P pilus assembly chaperone PapD